MVSNTIRDADNQFNRSGSPGGWELRNIGFRGYRGSSHPAAAVACTDPNQRGIIEECYFGDGGNGPGIWVAPEHAGEIIIRNCYFEGWGDNALYGSAPGNHSNHSNPGHGGVVKVENCYSINSNTSNFRLGTDGSYLKNCVSVNPRRGYWGFYNDTELINCDIHGSIYASDAVWDDPATIRLDNTRFSGDFISHGSNNATLVGSSAGQPEDYYPGVPLSPQAARDGNLTGDPGDGGGQNPPTLDDVINSNGENEITIRPQ